MGFKSNRVRGLLLASGVGMLVFFPGKGFAIPREDRGLVRKQENVRERMRRRLARKNQSLAVTGVRASSLLSSAPAVAPVVTPLFDSPVYDVAVYGGKAYVIGAFNRVSQERLGFGIPVDKVTGRPLSTFDSINGRIYNVAGDGNGGWFICGDFTKVGIVERKGIAHILSNGKLDATWSPAVRPGDYFDGISFFQGKLYAVNYFGTDNSNYSIQIVRMNSSTGQIEKSWTIGSGDGSSTDPYIITIEAALGRIYIGGTFSSLQGQPHNNIAAFDTSTEKLIPDWAGGTDDTVEQILVTNNAVIAGGRFNNANNVAHQGVAAFSPSKGTVLAWDPRLGSSYDNPQVYSMARNGNTLYLAGPFYQAGALEVNGFAAVDLGTGDALPVSTAPYTHGYIQHVAYDGGKIYLSDGRNSMAMTDAGAPLTWDPNTRGWLMSVVPGSNAIFLALDGVVGGEDRDGFAAYDLTSGAIDGFNPGPYGSYYGSLLLDGTTLYAASYRLSAIDVQSKTVTPWLKDTRIFNVHALVKKDDVVYVGGNFSDIDGHPRAGVAAFKATTGELLPWAPSFSNSAGYLAVYSMALAGDSILIGGQFDSVDGQNRKNLAAVNTLGEVQAWDPSPDGAVRVMTVAGNTVYVGGDFTHFSASSRNGFAACNIPSLSLNAFDPQLAHDDSWPSSVSGISVQNGIIYVGGGFNRVYGDQVRNSLAAFNETDRSLLPWSQSLGEYPELTFVKAIGDRVFVGGAIDSANGVFQKGLAEFPLAQMVAVVPIPPRNLVLTNRSTSTLSVQWDASPGAASYQVSVVVKDSPNQGWDETANALFTKASLIPNTDYTIRVKACSSAGCSALASLDAYTWAAVPQGLSTTSIQGASLGLTFETNGNPKGTLYSLQQADSPEGPFGKEKTIDGAPVLVDQLSPDTNYSFRILAKNFDGSTTNPSAVLTVKTGFVARLLTKSIQANSNSSVGGSGISMCRARRTRSRQARARPILRIRL